MNNIRLFIENTEVELNEKVSFAITKQFEDLTNPTTIIADWSKTVEIPFTENNNNLFGHIYNVDRLIAAGGSSLTGIYFNPYKKLDFRLLYGDNLVMSGYAKMVDIKRSNGLGYYNITLNGSVGKIFQELKKYTFDTTYEDEDYIIPTVGSIIEKNLVSRCWANNYNGIVKFTMDNALNDKFDYTSIEQKDTNIQSEIITLADKLDNEKSFSSITGTDAKTIIGKGLLPRDFGEIRSYLTQPFVVFKDLFTYFFNNFSSKTGYNVILDSDFFNTNNPYWNNYAMLLKRFTEVSNVNIVENARLKTDKTITVGTKEYTNLLSEHHYKWDIQGDKPGWNDNIWAVIDTPIKFDNYQDTHLNVFDWYNNRINLGDNDTFSTSSNFTIMTRIAPDDFNEIYITDLSGSRIPPTIGNTIDLSPQAAILVNIDIIGANGTTNTIYNCIVGENTTYDTTGFDNVIQFNKIEIVSGSTSATIEYHNSNTLIPFNITAKKSEYGDWIKFNISIQYDKSNQSLRTPFVYTINSTQNKTLVILSRVVDYIFWNVNTGDVPTYSILNGIKSIDELRSGSYFTIAMLWDNKYSPFDIILNYCKMFRIYVSVDEYNKQIKFIQANNLFRNNVTLDWTNKLDLSKDYIITPMSFDNKYVVFNYEDDKTKLGQEYKSKYGVNYGEKKLITQYNFNDNTTNLFTNLKEGIVNSDYVLNWNRLYTYTTITYNATTDVYAYNKGEDNKTTDTFGKFYFYVGSVLFDNSSNLLLPQMYISDDTPLQQQNKKYNYLSHDTTDYNYWLTQATQYSKLDNVYNGKLSLFNNPNEIFTFSNKSQYANATSIYDGYWKKYIEERYNVQNKKVTCYIRLKPNDFYNFSFANFVKIDNQLYVVNKIYDYDITSDESTKVDLITIQDTTGYTQYNPL